MPWLVLLFVCLAAFQTVNAQDWPGFRGPNGQGHSAALNVPLEWSESRNVAWKAAVSGRGWSSPAIAGGLAWITTAVTVGLIRFRGHFSRGGYDVGHNEPKAEADSAQLFR